MSENTQGLSPCAFCGSDKLYAFDNTVRCDDCDASGPDLGHVSGDKAREAAVIAWNTRAALSPEAKTGEGRDKPLQFSPEILAAHAQFGGDLEDMQRRYDEGRK